MGANLTDTYDWLIGALSDAGLPVVTDARNAQPPCVIVDPPAVSPVQSGYLVALSFPVTLVAPPPGNRDAVQWLLTAADDVLAAATVTGGGPGSYTLGTVECPAYELTVTVQIQRTP